MKKINFFMWAIMPFILIALFLFLPLFQTYYIATSAKDMTIYGFNFILGKFVKDSQTLANVTKISSSSMVIVIMTFLPITIVISNKFLKRDIALKLINVLISVAVVIYFYLFQFHNYKLLGDDFYNILAFKTTWLYSMLVVIYSLYAIYHITILVVSIRKKIKSKEEYLTAKEIKENNDL